MAFEKWSFFPPVPSPPHKSRLPNSQGLPAAGSGAGLPWMGWGLGLLAGLHTEGWFPGCLIRTWGVGGLSGRVGG